MSGKIFNFFKLKKRVSHKVGIQKEIFNVLNNKKFDINLNCNNNLDYIDLLMMKYQLAQESEAFSLRRKLKKRTSKETKYQLDATTAHLAVTLIYSSNLREISDKMTRKKQIQLRFLNDNLNLKETEKRLKNGDFTEKDYIFCYDDLELSNEPFVEYKKCQCEACLFSREKMSNLWIYAL